MSRALIILSTLVIAVAAKAADDDLEFIAPKESPSLAAVSEAKDLQPIETSSPLLNVAGRLDLGFSGGAPVAQGFYIPSLRFGINGTISSRLEYGFALGQTREFSAAQLPQMLPVDAWVSLRLAGDESESPLRVKMGMFNPTLNPWWTPDLAFLSLPDYQNNHRACLMDNDLGVELQFQPGTERLKFTLGVYNGNGIFSLNTNNSKAFSASVEAKEQFGESKVAFGISTFTQTQSASGSVNYKSNWAVDAYASVENGPWLGGVDVLTGGFEDATRLVYPLATGVFVVSRLAEDLHLFVRHETLRSSPTFSGNLTVWQMGPMIVIDRAFRAFFYYESSNGPSGIVNSGQVRLRLVM